MLDVIILIVDPVLTTAEFNSLIPFVSKEKQGRIRRFRFFRDAQNTLLGDILIRSEICRKTCLKNKELEFSTNKYGKPFITNNVCYYFNIAHSGNYVACSIASEPVGIDIELIEPIDLKLAERYFAPDETAYIMDSQSITRFFEVWTKKESRIKWEGRGLSKPLSSFSVFDSSELEIINYYNVFQNSDVISHVCSTSKEKPGVRIMDTTTLILYIKQMF